MIVTAIHSAASASSLLAFVDADQAKWEEAVTQDGFDPISYVTQATYPPDHIILVSNNVLVNCFKLHQKNLKEGRLPERSIYNTSFATMFVDEAHCATSKDKVQTALHFAAKQCSFTIAPTATPVQNSLFDLCYLANAFDLPEANNVANDDMYAEPYFFVQARRKGCWQKTQDQREMRARMDQFLHECGPQDRDSITTFNWNNRVKPMAADPDDSRILFASCPSRERLGPAVSVHGHRSLSQGIASHFSQCHQSPSCGRSLHSFAKTHHSSKDQSCCLSALLSHLSVMIGVEYLSIASLGEFETGRSVEVEGRESGDNTGGLDNLLHQRPLLGVEAQEKRFPEQDQNLSKIAQWLYGGVGENSPAPPDALFVGCFGPRERLLRSQSLTYYVLVGPHSPS